jgi:glutamate dehydrogenase (NAD(P)+)
VQDLQSFFWGETEVVDNCILENAYTQIVTLARKQKLPLAALSLGIKRVQEAKRIRGLFP